VAEPWRHRKGKEKRPGLHRALFLILAGLSAGRRALCQRRCISGIGRRTNQTSLSRAGEGADNAMNEFLGGSGAGETEGLQFCMCHGLILVFFLRLAIILPYKLRIRNKSSGRNKSTRKSSRSSAA
jgi:hypothetical protein